MRGQISAIILVFVIFISGFLTTMSGCNGIDSRYFTMIDSLDQTHQLNQSLLEVDMATIEARKELIDAHLMLIQRFLDDTISPDFGNQLSKYKGVKKVYTKFIKEYSTCKNELAQLKKQAKDLRASVEKKELSKDEFKKFYAVERSQGFANLQKSKGLIEPVHAVEPDYQRISVLVQDKLTEMSKSNQELTDILKQLNE